MRAVPPGTARRSFGLIACLCLGLAAGESQAQTSFEESYDMYLRRFSGGNARDVVATRQIEKVWSAPVFLRKLYPALDIDSFGRESFYEALYRRAVSQYELAGRTHEEFRAELQKIEDHRVFVDTWEPVWWRNIEGHERLNRQRTATRRRYLTRLSNEFRAVFDTLGQIGSTRIRQQERFINLQKDSYRMFSVYQLGLGRYAPALDVLEKYQRFPDVENEWPLHYYLSRSYGGLLRGARKDRSVPGKDLNELRRKRNLHFLRAVDLKFGRRSIEYETTFERIRREELGPVRRRDL